jgi:hypothetical protein
MGMVKSHVTTTLEAATERVNAVLKETAGPTTAVGTNQDPAAASAGPRVEGALIAYVQYQAVAEGIKTLMTDLVRRAARNWEYTELVDECQEVYFRQRHAILHAPTVTKLQTALGAGSLADGLRIGCAELCDLCHREHKLMQHFFPALERGGLHILLDPLCTELVDRVRPLFLKIVSVEELCGVELILKGEILEDRIEIRGDSLASMKPCISGLMHEVQERLTFRAQVFIRDEIQSFAPSKDELDYPARLQRTTADRSGGSGDDYAEWCAVLPRTLACLSHLYRTVDTKIFEGLAQEAVLACTEALVSCSRALTRLRGPADGGLFLVMHLLKLREQIVPFDVDFSSTELSLDFSDTRSALASLISSKRSIFSWSSTNALLSLAKAPPRVYHTLRNAKKDLERELKHACESFIMLTASQVAEPCVAWVRKADALIPAGAAAARVSAIREHGFAQPERVKELMAHLKRTVAAFNAETVPKMALYLSNPQTRNVLLTPIRNNIVDAYSRVHNYLLAEFESEEYVAMSVLAPEELAAMLGGHQVVLLSASTPSTPFVGDIREGNSFSEWETPERPNLGSAADLQLSAGPTPAAADAVSQRAEQERLREQTRAEAQARAQERARADKALADEEARLEAAVVAAEKARVEERARAEEQAQKDDQARSSAAEQATIDAHAKAEAQAQADGQAGVELEERKNAEEQARAASAQSANAVAAKDAEQKAASRPAKAREEDEGADWSEWKSYDNKDAGVNGSRDGSAALDTRREELAASARVEQAARDAAAREQETRVKADAERAAAEARAASARERLAKEAESERLEREAKAAAEREEEARAHDARKGRKPVPMPRPQPSGKAAGVGVAAASANEEEDYGPWTGFGSAPGAADAAAAAPVVDGAGAGADSADGVPHMAGVTIRTGAAARPHRGARPLAPLHRGAGAQDGAAQPVAAVGAASPPPQAPAASSPPPPAPVPAPVAPAAAPSATSAAAGAAASATTAPAAAAAQAASAGPAAAGAPRAAAPAGGARPAAGGAAGGAAAGTKTMLAGMPLPPGFVNINGKVKYVGK